MAIRMKEYEIKQVENGDFICVEKSDEKSISIIGTVKNPTDAYFQSTKVLRNKKGTYILSVPYEIWNVESEV